VLIWLRPAAWQEDRLQQMADFDEQRWFAEKAPQEEPEPQSGVHFEGERMISFKG
jgi:hypothetical protein